MRTPLQVDGIFLGSARDPRAEVGDSPAGSILSWKTGEWRVAIHSTRVACGGRRLADRIDPLMENR
jgi:hypothetical protein